MNTIRTGVVMLGLTLMPAIGSAAFTCQRDGKTIYGDQIPSECVGLEVRELYPDGSFRLIPAPVTEEQKKEKERKEQKRQACSELNKKQHDEDYALLDKYPHEEDLQEARYRDVGDQLHRVDLANARMKEILREGLDLTQEAMFYQPPNPKPLELQHSRELNSTLERAQLRLIEGAVTEIRRINDSYDAELARYRALTNGTAKMPCDAEKESVAPRR